MTSLVNTETGEIVSVSPEERTAVARLTTAIAALTEAVDFMPIAEVVSRKAEVVTIQTATRELHMSKEAQELAGEAVRRGEWAVGRAIRKGQAEGTIGTPSSGKSSSVTGLPKPSDFAAPSELYPNPKQVGIYDLAEIEADDFDAAIVAAKAEGNLSRANVARKAREAAGAERTPARRPLPDAFWTTLYDLGKKAESLHRLTQDDRWPANAKKLAARNRNELLRINDLMQQVINSLPEQESTHD